MASLSLPRARVLTSVRIMALPQPLLDAESAPLLGPDAARLREVLDALCLHGDPETCGRALLRRTELRLALSSIALSKPGPAGANELAAAIGDVQAAGRRFDENTDLELRARLLAGRLLVRTLKVGAASELLHGTRNAVKGKSRAARLQLEMLAGEIAIESKAYMDANRHFRRAVGLARGPQLAHEHYQATMSLAACAQLNADAPGAIPWLRQARQTAAAHRDDVRLSDAAFALGNLLLAVKDVGGARKSLTEAIDHSLSKTNLPMAYLVLARIHLGEGEFEAGVARAVEGAKAGAAIGNGAAFADGTIVAATCQAHLDRLDDALRTVEAGALALRQQGLENFAALVDLHRDDLLAGPDGAP